MINEVSINIILLITTIVVGALTTYFKTNAKLKEKATEYITDAEELYSGSTHAGEEKFEYVIDHLFNLVPVHLKGIFTREVISTIIQKTFDTIQAYAKMQLDKTVNTLIPDETANEEV